jgi:hypothetical protein
LTELERAASALRRLVEREDFAGVQSVLARYTRLLEAADKSESGLAQACALMEWARRNVIAARERISAERERLRGIACYRAPAGEAVSTLRVEG